MKWEEPGQSSTKGEVAPEVRAFFVKRYVAGWGVNANTVDLEKGRTLTSFRRDKESWCRYINERIAQEFPDCEAIDITCCYEEGSNLTAYTSGNFDHEKAKHQFPKILQIRTHPKHRARLTLLKNIDVLKKTPGQWDFCTSSALRTLVAKCPEQATPRCQQWKAYRQAAECCPDE